MAVASCEEPAGTRAGRWGMSCRLSYRGFCLNELCNGGMHVAFVSLECMQQCVYKLVGVGRETQFCSSDLRQTCEANWRLLITKPPRPEEADR